MQTAAEQQQPARIVRVETDRARYAPGEAVTVRVAASGRGAKTVRLRFVRPLDGQGAGETRETLALGGAASLRWTPPPADFTGYRVDVDLLDRAGKVVARSGTAVDVSSDWKRFPRYGFLSEFGAGVDPAATVAELNRYHLNGLQFYDWQWQHHRPYSPADTWPDIANRPVSRKTVRGLIDAAHGRGMKAMAYNLVAGAYAGYGEDGSGVRPEWGLFKKPGAQEQDRHSGLPSSWAAQEIFLFNPVSPGWQDHLFARQREVFQHFPFDGFHIDSLGDRGRLLDAGGSPVDLASTFAPFVNAARRALPGKSMVFNCVSAYGLEPVARSADVDFLYAELWDDPGLRTYGDLAALREKARGWAPDKALVYAAYMNRRHGEKTPDGQRRPFNPASVLLADAVIFAAGAAHVELGDAGQMLSTEYFPNRNLYLSEGLKADLVRMYDFAVAYQNLLRDPGVRPAPEVRTESAEEGVTVGGDGRPGSVWALARRHPSGAVAVHLLNLTAVPSPDWRDNDATHPDPPARKNVRLRLYGLAAPLRLFAASPEEDNGRPRPVATKPGRDAKGDYLLVTVPSLRRWTVLYTESAP